MNGPEHYRMADELLGRLQAGLQLGQEVAELSFVIQLAHAHATLALVAAFAGAQPLSEPEETTVGYLLEDLEAWDKSIAPTPKPREEES